MGNKEFFAPLSEHDRLRYRIVTERGDVVDFVVQYETLVGDEYRPVVRYDGSHGHGHRDILDGQGNVREKYWLPARLSLKDALGEARRDLQLHWRQYRDRFLRGLS